MSVDNNEAPYGEDHTATGQKDAITPFTKGQNDAVSRLRQQANASEEEAEFASAWTAEPGDELIGHFVAWSEGTTSRGETHRIAIVQDDAGTRWAVWAFYSVLKSKLEELNPQPGEMVLIQRKTDRESKRQGPGGRVITYRDYVVAVDR